MSNYDAEIREAILTIVNQMEEELPATKRIVQRQPLSYWITEQREWIDKCGGNFAGYVARYGRAANPHHYGDGAEAIYAADVNELARLLDLAADGHTRLPNRST